MRHDNTMGMNRPRRKYSRRPGGSEGGGEGGGRYDAGRDGNRSDGRGGGRGRGRDRGQRGGRGVEHGGGQEGGEGVSPRQLQHAKNAREKYLNMAQDAAREGDRVRAEYCLQHADHYTRILNAAQEEYESRQRSRGQPIEQQSYGEADSGGAEGEEHGGGGEGDAPDVRHGRRSGMRREYRPGGGQSRYAERPEGAGGGNDDIVPLPDTF